MLTHCRQMLVHAAGNGTAAWGIDFDIDEMFAFPGQPSGNNEERCENPSDDPRNQLLRFLADLPAKTLAVLIPRLDFGTNGHRTPPRATQATAYTHRLELAGAHKDRIPAGKYMFRAGALDPRSSWSRSMFKSNGARLHPPRCR